MELQYITHLAEAYKRGYEKKYAGATSANAIANENTPFQMMY